MVFCNLAVTAIDANRNAQRVAAYLKGKGASQVILFGSVRTGHFYPDHSDIDLYILGLPSELVNVILFDTFIAFPDLKLDLFSDADAPDYIKKDALATGLYI